MDYLCDILGWRECDVYTFPAAILPELERWLDEQWQLIPNGDIHRLLLSMRKRLT